MFRPRAALPSLRIVLLDIRSDAGFCNAGQAFQPRRCMPQIALDARLEWGDLPRFLAFKVGNPNVETAAAQVEPLSCQWAEWL